MAFLKNRSVLVFISVLLAAGAALPAGAEPSRARIRDLALHGGDVPRRLVGYGLVVGLEGTGDRSFGGITSRNATVHSVVNLLRRFHIEVPPEYLRLRNVAAVLVTAEVSPYLRSGGRFEIQVSALADALSLEGGVLWMTPLVTDPDAPPVATAQGPLSTAAREERWTPNFRHANSGRIPEGGVLEVDPPPVSDKDPMLFLRRPDRLTAIRIAERINLALGKDAATAVDPGTVKLTLSDDVGTALAVIDTLSVLVEGPARVVIHSRDGLVVAGGDIRVGSAVIHHRGITLQIGGTLPNAAAPPSGLVYMDPEALVQDVAAGLHAVGANPDEIAAILEALREAGALNAEVVVR